MELQISIAQQLPEVTWNYEEIKAEVAAKAKEYATIVYTEDAEKEMKADRAKLNKFREGVEDEKKRIKNLYNIPYKNFEAQVKDVLDPINSVITQIDGNLREIENKWKSERQILLRNEWTNYINELRELVPFEKLDDGSQYKKSISDKKAQEWVRERINTIKTELKTLEVVPEEFRNTAVSVYLGGWSLSQALEEGSRLQRLAETRRKAEEEAQIRKEKEEAEKAAAGEQITLNFAGKPTPEPTPEPQPAPKETQPAPEKKFFIRFEAHGTRDQLMALKDFMDANLIEFTRI